MSACRTVQSYRDLHVWQKAMSLVPEIYRVLRVFPREETYALTDQIRRAVVSIPANIAEGQARQGRGEFLYHLSVARASLAELETLLLIAEKLGYVNAKNCETLVADIADIRMPLQGLINRLKALPRTTGH